MMDRDPIHRRYMLAAGALAAVIGSSRTASAMAPPDGMTVAHPPMPTLWDNVPRIALWPGAMPETGFAAQAGAPDQPAVFLRNVARPEMRVFRPSKPNGRALLVIPGGAYAFVSVRNEGIDVASRFTAMGYTVFVLIYRLPGEGWTHRSNVPLEDAQRAIRTIRANATPFGLDSGRIAVLGFSAGGHLAASLATAFAERPAPAVDDVDAMDARPDLVGLIYPVIAMTPDIGHAESTRLLLGPAPDARLIARRSPAEHVDQSTPPMFLVHALDDPAVPAENSLVMMRAMQSARRPVEVHLFARGGHGFGMGSPDLPASAWPDLFARWIDDRYAQR